MSCSGLKYNFTKSSKKFNVLLGCSGSVAAVSIPLLVSKITEVLCRKEKIASSEMLLKPNSLSNKSCHDASQLHSLRNIGAKYKVSQPRTNFASHQTPAQMTRVKTMPCSLGVTTTSEVEVRLITTEHAKHFFKPQDLSVVVYEDRDAWNCWKEKTDPVLHIELRNWADLLLIAPLGSNTLAKLANGLSDNLLTLVARAWDFNKPILFATAMNTSMWEHPITGRQVTTLKELGYQEIPCIVKRFYSGEVGIGGMAQMETIAEYVREIVSKSIKK